MCAGDVMITDRQKVTKGATDPIIVQAIRGTSVIDAVVAVGLRLQIDVALRALLTLPIAIEDTANATENASIVIKIIEKETERGKSRKTLRRTIKKKNAAKMDFPHNPRTIMC